MIEWLIWIIVGLIIWEGCYIILMNMFTSDADNLNDYTFSDNTAAGKCLAFIPAIMIFGLIYLAYWYIKTYGMQAVIVIGYIIGSIVTIILFFMLNHYIGKKIHKMNVEKNTKKRTETFHIKTLDELKTEAKIREIENGNQYPKSKNKKKK